MRESSRLILGCVRYHWSQMVGPKIELKNGVGMRYHAKEMATTVGSEWYFEEIQYRLAPTSMLLVRIVVGKVANGNRLIEILRNTPIRQGHPQWNCVRPIKRLWARKSLSGAKCGTKRWLIVKGRKTSTDLMERATLMKQMPRRTT